MAELADGTALPDFAQVDEPAKHVRVETLEQAIEVARILGDDNTYGIVVTDEDEQNMLLGFLLGTPYMKGVADG